MNTNRRRVTRILCGALLAPALTSCAMLGTLVGSAKDGMKIAGGCPDMERIDSIAKVDFAEEFSVQPPVAAQLKAGVIASVSLRDLAQDIDADLKAGCGGLAKDLGDPTQFKSGADACQSAIKLMGEAKAKLGPDAFIKLDVKEPTCSVSLDAFADCAGKCDASVKDAKAEVKCEGELSGHCDADCSGRCELAAPATCAGTCEGTCDATISGTCEGNCEGTCDGKEQATGACAGKCEGKCDASGKAECAGKCTGSCQLAAAAKCEGTCTGACSVAFKEPVCSGALTPPKVSADCKASCDANASANLTCTPAHVSAHISGTKELEAAAKYKAALETHLPLILKVALGIVPKLGDVLGNAKATLEGGIAAGKAATSGRATAAAHMGQCLVTPFMGAIDAVGGLQATVSISVDFKASATASTTTSPSRKEG